jgi:hypothetical protein
MHPGVSLFDTEQSSQVFFAFGDQGLLSFFVKCPHPPDVPHKVSVTDKFREDGLVN